MKYIKDFGNFVERSATAGSLEVHVVERRDGDSKNLLKRQSSRILRTRTASRLQSRAEAETSTYQITKSVESRSREQQLLQRHFETIDLVLRRLTQFVDSGDGSTVVRRRQQLLLYQGALQEVLELLYLVGAKFPGEYKSTS